MRVKKTYQVLSGDNWFSIAQKLYGDQRMVGDLIDSNPGIRALMQGQVLRLPSVQTGREEIGLFSNQDLD